MVRGCLDDLISDRQGADGRDGRVSEDGPRDGPVVRTSGFAAQVGQKHSGLVVGGMGEGRNAGHVTGSPDVIGAEDPACLVHSQPIMGWLQSERLEAYVVHPRISPGSQQHPLGLDGTPVGQIDYGPGH